MQTVLLALLLYIPTLLDTGVQLWNAVEINWLVTAGNISYPGPLCCQTELQSFTDSSTTDSPSTKSLTSDWITILKRGQFRNPKVKMLSVKYFLTLSLELLFEKLDRL